MVMDMELLLSMCPRLTMDMVITHNLTPTDITLDTDMVRGLLKLSQDMVMAMPPATPTEAHRDSMDTMVVMDMVMVMVRGLLMLSQDMAMVMDMELLLSMCPRLTMDMVITHKLTPTDITLDTDMVRGLMKLSQDMVMAMLPATPTEAHRDSM